MITFKNIKSGQDMEGAKNEKSNKGKKCTGVWTMGPAVGPENHF